MLLIYAALAEKGRRMIGERTRAGLAAAEKRGVKLGGLNAKGIAEQQAARERAEQLRPLFAELVGMSARKAAEELNPTERCHCSRRQVARGDRAPGSQRRRCAQRLDRAVLSSPA